MSALGKLAYYSVFRPFWFCTRFFRHDGFVGGLRARREGTKMREAVGFLPPLPAAAPGPSYHAHYLTGAGFFGLSGFAAYSLEHHTDGRVAPVFHSDGRLDALTVARLQRALPTATFVGEEEQRDLVARHLPVERFPALNRAWGEFTLIRKLLSVHLGRQGWNVFIDSDTLFWRSPGFLLDWYQRPSEAFCLQDNATVYGYEASTLERLAGRPLPPKVNTGLVGILSESIDWSFLEYCTRELIAAPGMRHFMEQALTAVLFARQPFRYAPPADYFIPVRVEQCLEREGVFQHYAGDARPWLYRRAWRLFRTTLGSAA
jgi:hypothetical protein